MLFFGVSGTNLIANSDTRLIKAEMFKKRKRSQKV